MAKITVTSQKSKVGTITQKKMVDPSPASSLGRRAQITSPATKRGMLDSPKKK